MRVAKALIYDADGYALVLCRSGTHPMYPHEADLPGGIIENGETYEEGLVREIAEECGITVMPGQLALLAETHPAGHSDKRLYEIRLIGRPVVSISWEHEKYEWVSKGSLRDGIDARDTFMRFAASVLTDVPQ